MPEQGPCLRVELNNSFKDSKTLSQRIKEIAKEDDGEYTPDDFLKDRLSKSSNINHRDSIRWQNGNPSINKLNFIAYDRWTYPLI